jgi:hypothetical protein
MFRGLAAVVCTIVTGAGCAQLAGIDQTSGKDRSSNTVAIQRLSIGSTVVRSDLDLGGLQATYLVVDPASATGFETVAADDGKAPQQGTWHADLPDPTPVLVTLPDLPVPVPRLLALPSRALRVVFTALEHPGRSPAPDGAMLTVTAPLETPTLATDSFRAFTLGSWTSRMFASTELPAVGALTLGPVTYEFTTVTNLSGRPQLDRLTAQDTFLVLRYSGNLLTGVAEAPPFAQIGNDAVTTPTMTPVVADQTLDVNINPAALSDRFIGARPAVGALSMGWNIVAAPGASTANNTGPVLQSGGVSGGVTAKYGNPFAARGWTSMFSLGALETRVYMAPNPIDPLAAPIPVTLSAAMNQFLDLSPGIAPQPGFELMVDAALPVTISLDGNPLLIDGKSVAKPTRLVEVAVQADRTTATLYQLQVYDLVPNAAATALEFHFILEAAASEPRFELPPETFQSGHSYTMRALCTSGGYPGIASGDLQTRALPMSLALLDSAVFTVMP